MVEQEGQQTKDSEQQQQQQQQQKHSAISAEKAAEIASVDHQRLAAAAGATWAVAAVKLALTRGLSPQREGQREQHWRGRWRRRRDGLQQQARQGPGS